MVGGNQLLQLLAHLTQTLGKRRRGGRVSGSWEEAGKRDFFPLSKFQLYRAVCSFFQLETIYQAILSCSQLDTFGHGKLEAGDVSAMLSGNFCAGTCPGFQLGHPHNKFHSVQPPELLTSH